MKTEKLVGGIIAWIICSTMLYWYNHIWYIYTYTYWQWLVLGLVYLWIAHSIKRIGYWISTILFFSALVLQILSWFGTVKLPIIK